MSAIQEQLRQRAADLLREKTIDVFVGYAASDVPLRTAVCAARDEGQARELVWNAFCTSNLAALLPSLIKRPVHFRGEWTPPRVGVLAKGCVSRSIVGLIKAHQIPRDAVYVVGVSCAGTVDRHRASRLLGTAEPIQAKLGEDDRLWLRSTDGSERDVALADVLLEGCLECRHRDAVLADEWLGERGLSGSGAGRYARVEAFAERPRAERWRTFQGEISRCIRCYACREACPNCYCPECFADETAPQWVGATTEISDLMLFHLGRAFHQAGRCVDCGACVAACPQGIDLRLLNEKINRDVESLFGGNVGVSADEPEPLMRFEMSDDEGFLTEP